MPWVLLAYLAATAGAVIDALMLGAPGDAYDMSLVGYFASVLWIFAFSALFKNSSIFDPFWSVAPPILLGWWTWNLPEGERTRQALLLACTCIWAARLTWNWARGFEGIKHEDWRYRQLQEQTGGFYWIVSLVGIHYFPAILVWIGCIPAYRALGSAVPLNPLDAMATLVCLGATAIEAVADNQLREHRKAKTGQPIRSGLWAYSRHPNYLGEVGFWVGVFLFGLAGGLANLWTVVAPLTLYALFRFVSIPLMERRQSGKPGYESYQKEVPILLTWPGRRSRSDSDPKPGS